MNFKIAKKWVNSITSHLFDPFKTEFVNLSDPLYSLWANLLFGNKVL